VMPGWTRNRERGRTRTRSQRGIDHDPGGVQRYIKRRMSDVGVTARQFCNSAVVGDRSTKALDRRDVFSVVHRPDVAQSRRKRKFKSIARTAAGL
jgi:hypothetical protein